MTGLRPHNNEGYYHNVIPGSLLLYEIFSMIRNEANILVGEVLSEGKEEGPDTRLVILNIDHKKSIT